MSLTRQDLLAFIGQLAVTDQLPKERSLLVDRLRQAGFGEGDIDSVLLGEGPREGAAVAPPEHPVPVHHFSDEATRFLNALRDLGYLDETMEEEILDTLLEDGAERVELADARRHVAAVLFDRRGELDRETQQYLEDEWRLAFH